MVDRSSSSSSSSSSAAVIGGNRSAAVGVDGAGVVGVDRSSGAVTMAEAVATAVRNVEGCDFQMQREEEEVGSGKEGGSGSKIDGLIGNGIGSKIGSGIEGGLKTTNIAAGIGGVIGSAKVGGTGEAGAGEGGTGMTIEELGVRFLTSMSLDSDDASASPEALEVGDPP